MSDTRELLNNIIYPKLSAKIIFSDLENLKIKDSGIVADCPVCGRAQHFFCYHDGHYGKCKAGTCGSKVSWWEYTKKRYGLSTNRDVLCKLAELAGVSLPENTTNGAAAISTLADARNFIIQLGRRNALQMPASFASYMLMRGFDRDTIKRSGILYVERESMIKTLFNNGITKELLRETGIASAKFGEGYRLIMPHYDEEGVCIGFIGRLNPGLEPVDGNLPKYKNSAGFTGMNLDVPFGFQEANQPSNHKIVIVEGPLDAILINVRCELKGVKAIALCGHSVTERAVAMINGASPPVVVLALDDDAGGKAGAMDLVKKLKKRVFVANNYKGFKDPGELIAAEGPLRFRESLLSAAPVPVWIFSIMLSFIRSVGPAGRVDVLAETAPIYRQLVSDEERRLFMESARKATLLHPETISGVVGA